MTEPLDREQMIALLDSLGSERDEDVLAAARDVHAKIDGAGLSWQDLLRPEAGGDEPGELEPEPESDPEPENEPQAPFEAQADALKLIGELLAKKNISADLRTELEDYKTDIAEGEFGGGDLKYLHAVAERLGGD